MITDDSDESNNQTAEDSLSKNVPENIPEKTNDYPNATLGENFTSEKNDVATTELSEEKRANSGLTGQISQDEQRTSQLEPIIQQEQVENSVELKHGEKESLNEKVDEDSNKLNDFDANLMGGVEDDNNIIQNVVNTIPREDSVQREIVENIPVLEKKIDVPQAPTLLPKNDDDELYSIKNFSL